MTGADYIIVTEVAKLDDLQIIITAKILDVESAQMENAADVRTSIDINMMEVKCNDLAKSLFKWNPLIEKIEADEPFFIAEQMPLFQGGGLGMFRMWCIKNLCYPRIAMENGIQGRVILTFIIERDGSLTNIEVLQSPDQLLSEEAIRLLTQSPKWEPGKQRNFPVRFEHNNLRGGAGKSTFSKSKVKSIFSITFCHWYSTNAFPEMPKYADTISIKTPELSFGCRFLNKLIFSIYCGERDSVFHLHK